MYTGISAADRTRGLQDERRVVEWLSRRYTVSCASREQQIRHDIDCWVYSPSEGRGISISIKSQVAGMQYQNYCLEVLTEQNNGEAWTTLAVDRYNSLLAGSRTANFMPLTDELMERYRPAWALFGQAERYMFLFGNKLVTINSNDLWQHLGSNGADYTRWLAAERLEGQGGRNAQSAYVYWRTLVAHQVPHRTLFL